MAIQDDDRHFSQLLYNTLDVTRDMAMDGRLAVLETACVTLAGQARGEALAIPRGISRRARPLRRKRCDRAWRR